VAKRSALKTNEKKLIEMAAMGQVAPPVKRSGWRVGPDGVPAILPGVGGITYNCKVGDSAVDWAADHVEPGVSIKTSDVPANIALNTLACIGNTVTVITGAAKGARGVVTGKHGGIEHVLADFADSALAKLAIGDKIQLRACGLGLALDGLDAVKLMNMSPELLRKMAPKRHGDRLVVGVTHRIPAVAMGSGLGHDQAIRGDYDVQLFDDDFVAAHNLQSLRLGDVVAIDDADHTHGRIYRGGAVSIGVIVHTCCTQAGHGPGVTSLMTSASGMIEAVPDPKANIARYLKIGTARPRPRKKKG
jgi:uncharacterized protein DUF4438